MIKTKLTENDDVVILGNEVDIHPSRMILPYEGAIFPITATRK
jgi:hypothetical protein